MNSMTTIRTQSKVSAREWSNQILGRYAKVATRAQVDYATEIHNSDMYMTLMVTPIGPGYRELDAALGASFFAPTVKPLGLTIDCLGRKSSVMNPAFIAAVMLPKGKEAWQVGPRGRIFADITHAIKYASVLAYDRKAA